MTRLNMVGTACQEVTRSFWISVSTSSALNRPAGITMRLPSSSAVIPDTTPPLWNIGVVMSVTFWAAGLAGAAGRPPRMMWMVCCVQARLRWDCCTPLGTPVLPAVKTTRATSSSRMASRSTVTPLAGRGRRHQAASVSGGMLFADTSGILASGMSVTISRGLTRSTTSASSPSLHHRLPRIGTAPTRQAAHCASRNSGELYNTISTLSPVPTPRRANSTAALSMALRNMPKLIRLSFCTRKSCSGCPTDRSSRSRTWRGLSRHTLFARPRTVSAVSSLHAGVLR